MKVLHVKGLATHDGPESWRDAGNRFLQALTGGVAGRVLNREMQVTSERRPSGDTGKATFTGAFWLVPAKLCAVIDPVHVTKHLTRKPGGPIARPQCNGIGDRAVNPEGVQQR